MPISYVSIGSNIDRDVNIPASLKALSKEFGALTLSSIYETAPIGFDGDQFYNLIVGFNTDQPAKTVAQILRQIELEYGRTRNCQKFSARTLDLDLILYGDLIINDEQLQIPRDEIEKYAFVLEPLAEIAPKLQHPISHMDYAMLWKRFDKSNLKQKRIYPDWLKAL